MTRICPVCTPHECRCATDAPCGSVEKIEALRARAEHEEELWHPDDNPQSIRPDRRVAAHYTRRKR